MTNKYSEQIKSMPIYQQALSEGITIEIPEVEVHPVTGRLVKVVHDYIRNGEKLCRNTTLIPEGTKDGLESIIIAGLDTARNVGDLDFSGLTEELQAAVDAEED